MAIFEWIKSFVSLEVGLTTLVADEYVPPVVVSAVGGVKFPV